VAAAHPTVFIHGVTWRARQGIGCKEPHRRRGRRDLAEEDRQVSLSGVIRVHMTSTLYDPCLGPQIDFSR